MLADVAPHDGQQNTNYAFTDTLAIPGVTYYYKLGAVGQASESVFPVVISAALKPDNANLGDDKDPVTLLPGEKLELYVRARGQVQLDLLNSGESQPLVNDELAPGIYEIEPPADVIPLKLRLTHDSGFTRDLSWPLQ